MTSTGALTGALTGAFGPHAAPLVLASASPRRLALLSQIGITPSEIRPTEIDETPHQREVPRPHAERLAREKLHAAMAAGRPDGLSFILAADTVVAVGRRILPKAETRDQAVFCLGLLQGRRHHVITAIALVTPSGRVLTRTVDTAVIFARLSAADIEHYLDCDEWQGKAGGYAIQGVAAGFVADLSGSYSGVVGLPLHETVNLLRGNGFWSATPK